MIIIKDKQIKVPIDLLVHPSYLKVREYTREENAVERVLFFENFSKDDVSLYYKEVQSISAHVPFVNSQGDVLWLDLESKLVYISDYPLSVYIPWFSLEGLFDSKSIKTWEGWSKHCLGILNVLGSPTPLKSLVYAFLLISTEDVYFNSNKSKLSNYVSYSKKDSGSSMTTSVVLDNSDYRLANTVEEIDLDFFRRFISDLGLYSPAKKTEPVLPLAILEDSFQSFYLKDMIGALVMEHPLDNIIEGMEKAGIFETLPELKLFIESRDNENVIKFLNTSKSAFPTSGTIEVLEQFPFELIQMQVSKIVRRFKLRGVI